MSSPILDPINQIVATEVVQINHPTAASVTATTTTVTKATTATTYNESCVVCLDELATAETTADVGSPLELVARLPCGHLFHNFCIKTWSERTNSCPACREAFNVIEIIDLKSSHPTHGADNFDGCQKEGLDEPKRDFDRGEYQIIESYIVEDRKAPMPDEPLDITLLDPIYYQDHPARIHPQLTQIPADELGNCVICDSGEFEHELLICDGCNNCLHMSCLGIATVPTGEWFCPTCEIELANGSNMTDLHLETLGRLLGGNGISTRGRGRSRGRGSTPIRRGRARTRTVTRVASSLAANSTTPVTRFGSNGLITRSLGGRVTRSRSRSSSIPPDLLTGTTDAASGSSLIQFLWSNNNNNTNGYILNPRGRTAQDYRYNPLYTAGLYETRQAMQRTRREQGIAGHSDDPNSHEPVQLVPGRRIAITPEERQAWDMFDQAREITHSNGPAASEPSDFRRSTAAITPSVVQQTPDVPDGSRKLKRPVKPRGPLACQAEENATGTITATATTLVTGSASETRPFQRPKLVSDIVKGIRGERAEERPVKLSAMAGSSSTAATTTRDTPSVPQSSSSLGYDRKVQIQNVVRDNLRPLYQQHSITKPQYTHINQTVSRRLYREFGHETAKEDADGGPALMGLNRLAQEHIAAELRRVM
ncbi:hypothetical protein NADFUDRAFT_81444 [Nadsonia fulvescens var. elongata DSM 6958]|uniref:RING-type domain-containing protein n=1 Tax=Nadsonia fulvescens var. elongata DSM 6958 TaxID=857566 RepID=A0A1E3PUH3_9ASCO|nr:hypothetical protein NADFUDRAFT_81444 [Nadsonia fulvescens var. elongata DSM 6958]